MRYVFVILIVLVSLQLSALELVSAKYQVKLIELYTSEGCSSCPPADRWMSKLKDSPALWRDYVPLSFHVDYWDYLGWKDRFADTKNIQRQYRYKKSGSIKTVYTPGLVLNGKEWRDWSSFNGFNGENFKLVGELKVTMADGEFTATYSPDSAESYSILNLVLLGMNIQSRVKRGENSGRTLQHDFVVLRHRIFRGGNNQWSGKIPSSNIAKGSKAIAFWVQSTDSMEPIQSLGAYLIDEK